MPMRPYSRRSGSAPPVSPNPAGTARCMYSMSLAALCGLTADPLHTNPFRLETSRCTMRFPMTTPELCELAGLTRPELRRWIDAGLLEADRDGRRREFADDDLERARLIKALHAKGLPLSRLARENLAFDGRFVIFDGRTL